MHNTAAGFAAVFFCAKAMGEFARNSDVASEDLNSGEFSY
jgi:hypothetical protein